MKGTNVGPGETATRNLFHRAREVFDHALAAAAQERPALVERECGGDAALRAEVESLLASRERAGESFLEPTSGRDANTPHSSGTEARRYFAPPVSVAAWAESLVGRRVGQYTLVRLLAMGGMGSVYEAAQEHPRRAVALKVLRPGLSAPSALARFRLEPEILGRLRHANIAQVYESGVEDGGDGPVPYFAMELIAGALTLSEYVTTRELGLRPRMELLARVCDAVQHGHQKGIIHRDLKPANILVGEDGEPKVIDFGVARATDSDVLLTTQHTHAGDLIGTLRYMSPEQCDGDPAKIDTRTDIYALGVVLYELLTGVSPYDTAGTTLPGAIRVIREEPPRRPSELNRALRGDVDAILLKALEKEPGRRYGSAAELARDIRRHLAGEPTEARPPTAWTRFARWIARRPVLATAAACVVLVAVSVGASTAATWYAIMRPERVKLNESGDTATLETAWSYPLHRWKGGETRDILTFGVLVERPEALGGGRIALIGYHPSAESLERGSLAAFDLRRSYRTPIRKLALELEDIPVEELRRRGWREDRPMTPDMFGPDVALLADVFDDPPGVAADELIVIFKHKGVTHSAICIYRLDWTLLYRVWIDADIERMSWLAGAGVLVCSGRNGEAVLSEREAPDAGEAHVHPWVVFAVQPALGVVCGDYVRQEPSELADAPEHLKPVWYKCVWPFSDEHRFALRNGRLENPERGADANRFVTFVIEVRSNGNGRFMPSDAGRAWEIDGRSGEVRDTPNGDAYRLHERSPANPDGCFPPYESWYLDELPPKKAVAASQPEPPAP